MSNQLERATCNKKGCEEISCATLTVYTENGPMAVASCKSHLLTLSGLIDALVESMMQE